jgi:hypothetical protein
MIPDDYLLDEVDEYFEDVMEEVLGDLNIDTYSSSDWEE